MTDWSLRWVSLGIDAAAEENANHEAMWSRMVESVLNPARHDTFRIRRFLKRSIMKSFKQWIKADYTPANKVGTGKIGGVSDNQPPVSPRRRKKQGNGQYRRSFSAISFAPDNPETKH
jgi:hypothetical protein